MVKSDDSIRLVQDYRVRQKVHLYEARSKLHPVAQVITSVGDIIVDIVDKLKVVLVVTLVLAFLTLKPETLARLLGG